MKYNGIKIGKPKNYVFVRGTSFQEAASFLFNNNYKIGSISKEDPSFMSVFSRYDFTRDRSFSNGFEATNQSDVLERAREIAFQRASRDYMYVRNFNGQSLGDIFEHHDKIDFWVDFGKEVHDDIETLTFSDYYFRSYNESKNLKGVNIYFNKGLMRNYSIRPNQSFDDYTKYNLVDIMTQYVHDDTGFNYQPFSSEYIVAIEPLGDYEEKRFNQVLKKRNPFRNIVF